MGKSSDLRELLALEYINVVYGAIPTGIKEAIGITTTNAIPQVQGISSGNYQLLIRTPVDYANNKDYLYCENRSLDIMKYLLANCGNLYERSSFYVNTDDNNGYIIWSLNITIN